MQDIEAQLAEELAPAPWQTLIPHAKRDALIVVSSQLSLLEVGLAIAQDNTLSVQHWISEQLICKPDSEQLTIWNKHPEQEFNTLIVQPYVLIQNTDS